MTKEEQLTKMVAEQQDRIRRLCAENVSLCRDASDWDSSGLPARMIHYLELDFEEVQSVYEQSKKELRKEKARRSALDGIVAASRELKEVKRDIKAANASITEAEKMVPGWRSMDEDAKQGVIQAAKDRYSELVAEQDRVERSISRMTFRIEDRGAVIAARQRLDRALAKVKNKAPVNALAIRRDRRWISAKP